MIPVLAVQRIQELETKVIYWKERADIASGELKILEAEWDQRGSPSAERHQERELELAQETIGRLEFSLGQADRITADQAARITALEAERDRADFSIVVELRERVAALEAERDRLLARLQEPMVTRVVCDICGAPTNPVIIRESEDSICESCRNPSKP